MTFYLHCYFLCVILYLHCRIAVSQVQMSIAPSEVVLTTSSPPDTTFMCTISSSISVTTIYNMHIRSKGVTGTESVVMAKFAGTSPALTDNAPQGSSVSGGIDTNTPSASTLTLTRPTADIVCSDRGYYECLLTYQDANSNFIVSENNQTLSIYAIPSDVSLSARKNGQLIQGTVTNYADVDVGEMVEFTCLANIGSINSTRIRWKRTSEIGTIDNFIIYNPPQGTYDDGTPSLGPTDCTYSRTATMSYNVTSFDANRDNNLAFQCYISVVPPGQNEYETQNPPSFYINPDTVLMSSKQTVSGNPVIASVPNVIQTCPGSPLGLAVGLTIGALLFIEGVVGAVIYYIINRRKSSANNSTAGHNVYEVPNRRAFETEHVYNQ